MNGDLTICMISSRHEPHFDWFLESLKAQLKPTDNVSIILVDKHKAGRKVDFLGLNVLHVEPKPCVWQGPTRLSKNERWAASNYRNTGLCYAKTKWICWLDDRCVVMPGWMRGARDAMKHGYAVFGSYEKGHNLVVEKGVLKSFKETDGKDCRATQVPNDAPFQCPGEWSFGCCVMCPVEWALKIGGWEEFLADGMGYEDIYFGMMLKNSGYPTCFDRRMKIMQDRTPGQTGPDMLRTDKGVSPDDKSHALLYALRQARHTMNLDCVEELRTKILAGGKFPTPTKPTHDWYDGEPISQM